MLSRSETLVPVYICRQKGRRKAANGKGRKGRGGRELWKESSEDKDEGEEQRREQERRGKGVEVTGNEEIIIIIEEKSS